MKTTEHKQFNAFDRVLVRYDSSQEWDIDLYSHFDNKTKRHITMQRVMIKGDIIPYEGNEHLVGEVDEPEEEVKLEEGEYVFVSDCRNAIPCTWDLRIYDSIIDEYIGVFKIKKHVRLESERAVCWYYAIRFADFNPNDMKETFRHVLCVKNGKIVRCKE